VLIRHRADNLESWATFSPCLRYRYSLGRQVKRPTTPPDNFDIHSSFESTPLLFVMLNPSTADEQQDDQTIRLCCGWARKLGYGSIVVVNLFAWRATNPLELYRTPDPIGTENDAELARQARQAGRIICAWGGTHGHYRQRARTVRSMLAAAGLSCWALKVSGRTGEPCHPLRLPYRLEPQPFNLGG
jgi:hypothetical protein